ncbi:hypothetical protein [Aliarcobacter butzleri]|uniref:hypothetical protein n=1 Tax=Aliarcobacter butzleri TaxID=28197 RepID=UPI00126A67E8|nr:hypothetical protein [Aliarcobacter butzleri]
MSKIVCPLCGGNIKKEKESTIAEFVCISCDCLMNINDRTITLKSDASFYLANYGTTENVEIFTDYAEAKKNSVDGIVHKAILSSDCVWYEDGLGWNYEDCSHLYSKTPCEVSK